MKADPGGQVTELLARWRDGDREALDRLAPIVYAELKKLARHYLRQERAGHTLQCTALVNEAYVRLVEQKTPQWNSRAHFFGVAARLMRQILVDHARARDAAKRGGGAERITLVDDIAGSGDSGGDLDLIALDDALTGLAAVSPEQSRLVELRYFSGLTIEETSEVMGVSPATVKRNWTAARAWLFREISRRQQA